CTYCERGLSQWAVSRIHDPGPGGLNDGSVVIASSLSTSGPTRGPARSFHHRRGVPFSLACLSRARRASLRQSTRARTPPLRSTDSRWATRGSSTARRRLSRRRRPLIRNPCSAGALIAARSQEALSAKYRAAAINAIGNLVGPFGHWRRAELLRYDFGGGIEQ